MTAPKRIVYLIHSIRYPPQRYVGLTSNLNRRMVEHNEGKCPHTAGYRPWQVIVSLQFSDEQLARRFERYLKTASGRAFSANHFRQFSASPKKLPAEVKSVTVDEDGH